MKALLLLLALIAVGCGKGISQDTQAKVAPGPCSDVSNGNWQNVVNAQHKVALTANCEGATTYCNEVFTYHPQANGTSILLVTMTNGGPECLPLGATTCSASMDAQGILSVNCGGGKALTSNYNRL